MPIIFPSIPAGKLCHKTIDKDVGKRTREDTTTSPAVYRKKMGEVGTARLRENTISRLRYDGIISTKTVPGAPELPPSLTALPPNACKLSVKY